MSQLILRTNDEYLPLLWQHDGLTMCNWCEPESTIISLYEDTLETLQNTLLDITTSIGIEIPLEISPMEEE